MLEFAPAVLVVTASVVGVSLGMEVVLNAIRGGTMGQWLTAAVHGMAAR